MVIPNDHSPSTTAMVKWNAILAHRRRREVVPFVQTPFVFAATPPDVVDLVHDLASELTYGWGVVPAAVTIDDVRWTTPETAPTTIGTAHSDTEPVSFVCRVATKTTPSTATIAEITSTAISRRITDCPFHVHGSTACRQQRRWRWRLALHRRMWRGKPVRSPV